MLVIIDYAKGVIMEIKSLKIIFLMSFALVGLFSIHSKVMDEHTKTQKPYCLIKQTPEENGNQQRILAPKISFGFSCRQGKRSTMEDAFFAYPSLNQTNTHLFGIFDGHGGRWAADIAAAIIPKYFSYSTGFGLDAVIKDIFSRTHQDIIQRTTQGTTAVLAVLQNINLHLSWIADSRAVLEEFWRVGYETKDHELTDPKEVGGVWARGGKVMIMKNTGGIERELTDLKQLPLFEGKKGKLRVNGVLNMPRALGDRDIIGIGHEPDMVQLRLSKNNHFLILACDGVWDVLASQEAVNTVAEALKTATGNERHRTNVGAEVAHECGDPRAMTAARALIDRAYDRWSGDNISAIVIVFNWD